MSTAVLTQVHSALLSLCAALAVAVVIVATALFGGRVEGLLFPVVTDAAISRNVLVDGTRTRIWGSFERPRDCAFVRVEWWLGQPSNGSRVAVVFEEAAKDRNVGPQYFGPWVVSVPQDVFPFTTAIAVHRCHPLWETRTVFYHPE